jgi:hypothetical protein
VTHCLLQLFPAQLNNPLTLNPDPAYEISEPTMPSIPTKGYANDALNPALKLLKEI